MGKSIACSDESATQPSADSPSEQESLGPPTRCRWAHDPSPPRPRNEAGLIAWSTAVADGSHIRALQGGLDRALAG
jgi:hypothetical protein